MLKIAVPLDGSRLAEQAIQQAVAVAKAYPAEIVLLRVLSDADTEGDRRSLLDSVDWQLRRRQAEAYLEDLTKRLRTIGLKVRSFVEEGKAAETICRFTTREKIDLVVLTRFGKGGVSEFSRGSTAHKVVDNCPVCVLLTGPAGGPKEVEEELRYRHILVPIDGSLSSEWALGMGVMIARAHDAELDIVQIVQDPELPARIVHTRDLSEIMEKMQQCLRLEAIRRVQELQAQLPPGTKLHSSVITARDVSAALHRAAEAFDVDLIVMSAHGCGGEDGWRYGSVCESLLAHTTRPVLVLQQGQAELTQTFKSIHLAEPQADVG